MGEDISSAEVPHLLVVDDDARLRKLLKRYLEGQGFHVTLAADAAIAEKLMGAMQFSLVILDVMMPNEDGFSFAKRYFGENSPPLIFLTARAESHDRIRGLESGGDDYLPKPFEPQELSLRIRAILRRASERGPVAGKPPLAFAGHAYSFNDRALYAGRERISLTHSERVLLGYLAQHPDQDVSREDIAKAMEADGAQMNDRAVDVSIARLRRKIEIDGDMPHPIQTIRNVGYRLVTNAKNT